MGQVNHRGGLSRRGEWKRQVIGGTQIPERALFDQGSYGGREAGDGAKRKTVETGKIRSGLDSWT